MNNKEREESLTLGLLEAIEARNDLTQRHLANRLGVALGLTNSYLKRCVRKGLVKIKQAPANRYLYYLTPKGFSEKSRLTGRYLSHSFAFYRRAGESCGRALQQCEDAGWFRVGLYGASDLAEIAAIRATESKVKLELIYDPLAQRAVYMKIPVVQSCDSNELDAWIVTDLFNPVAAIKRLGKRWPRDRILVPDILTLPPGH